MGTLSAKLKAGVKSVQRGSATPGTASGTITITTVNTAKAFVIANAKFSTTPGNVNFLYSLASATTISFSVDAGSVTNLNWQVIEFY